MTDILETLSLPYFIGRIDSSSEDKGLLEQLVTVAAMSGCNAVAAFGGAGSADDWLDRLGILRELCQGEMDFICIPSNPDELELIEALEPSGWQVDSPLLNHEPLLRRIAETGRPTYLVTGSSTDEEIEFALDIIHRESTTLLHTIDGANDEFEEMALSYIPLFRKKYGVRIGHLTQRANIYAGIAAVALGAEVIEQPFTSDHFLAGIGNRDSLDRDQLKEAVSQLRSLYQSLQSPPTVRIPRTIEVESGLGARAMLVARIDLKAGEVLDASMASVSIGQDGLSPRMLQKILGLKLAYDVPAGTPFSLGLVVS